ncbi:hypothetical protein ACT453_12195, partial [Bacillus sp. D-CC]
LVSSSGLNISPKMASSTFINVLKLFVVVKIENNEVPSLCFDQHTIGFINSIGAEIDICLYLL